MADSLLVKLQTERDQKATLISNYSEAALAEDRDLTDTELETIAGARARIAVIDNQLAATADDLAMADDLAARLRISNLGPAGMRTHEYARAGDLLWDMIHQDDPDARVRFARAHKRAAEHLGLDKANTVAVAGGFNGLVVAPVVGPVLDPSPQGRPLFTALGPRDVTTTTFNRPRIVDPNFATGIAPQGKEKQELVSKTWDIVSEPVQLTVVGGYINLSMLLEEMLSGSLDMVVSHMNARLEYYTEIAAVDAVDNTTETVPLTDPTDPAAVQAAIAQASALVFKNTQRPATWIATGVDGWANLMALTDAAGRPMFPALGPANALGTGGANPAAFSSIMGLQAVLTFGITGNDYFVGNAYGLEVYERRLALMQVLEPSLRGRQISVASAIGFYAPITTEAGPGGTPAAERNGIVKIDVTG